MFFFQHILSKVVSFWRLGPSHSRDWNENVFPAFSYIRDWVWHIAYSMAKERLEMLKYMILILRRNKEE